MHLRWGVGFLGPTSYPPSFRRHYLRHRGQRSPAYTSNIAKSCSPYSFSKRVRLLRGDVRILCAGRASDFVLLCALASTAIIGRSFKNPVAIVVESVPYVTVSNRSGRTRRGRRAELVDEVLSQLPSVTKGGWVTSYKQPDPKDIRNCA